MKSPEITNKEKYEFINKLYDFSDNFYELIPMVNNRTGAINIINTRESKRLNSLLVELENNHFVNKLFLVSLFRH